MRLNDVRGLPVIDTRVARQAGVIRGVFIDPASGRIEEIEIEHGDGFLRERIPVSHVRQLGANVVLAVDLGQLEFTPPPRDDGRLVATDRLVGLEVYSEDGQRLGKLVDAALDPDTLTVTAYKLSTAVGPLPGGTRTVAPFEVVSWSRDVMIVRAKGQPDPARRQARPSLMQSLTRRALSLARRG